MEDEAIIGLFFGRDESALGELQQKYGRMLNSIARGITGDELDAEECGRYRLTDRKIFRHIFAVLSAIFPAMCLIAAGRRSGRQSCCR